MKEDRRGKRIVRETEAWSESFRLSNLSIAIIEACTMVPRLSTFNRASIVGTIRRLVRYIRNTYASFLFYARNGEIEAHVCYSPEHPSPCSRENLIYSYLHNKPNERKTKPPRSGLRERERERELRKGRDAKEKVKA